MNGHDPRLDVADTVFRFAYGLDERDWAAYRDVFVAPPAPITTTRFAATTIDGESMR